MTHVVSAKNRSSPGPVLHLRATARYLREVTSPFITALRAVVPLASANPSPGRAHDPSWGIWPCTVLKSRTTCEQLPVLSRSLRKAMMLSLAVLAPVARHIQLQEHTARHTQYAS